MTGGRGPITRSQARIAPVLLPEPVGCHVVPGDVVPSAEVGQPPSGHRYFILIALVKGGHSTTGDGRASNHPSGEVAQLTAGWSRSRGFSRL